MTLDDDKCVVTYGPALYQEADSPCCQHSLLPGLLTVRLISNWECQTLLCALLLLWLLLVTGALQSVICIQQQTLYPIEEKEDAELLLQHDLLTMLVPVPLLLLLPARLSGVGSWLHL
jgi:hypothetical protein